MLTVPALVYHKVADIPHGARFPGNYVRPRQFAAQLRWLRAAGFESISFADYVAYRRGAGRLPSRPILITFDDGYLSNRTIALPLLARFGFSATVFLVSDFIGATNQWDADEAQEPLLAIDDIRAMQRAGIEFQSHTRSHPRLTRLTAADAFRELRESRAALETMLETPVSVVAYPWGECDVETQRSAREAGYDAGVIVRRRTNFENTPLLELRRIGINHETTLARFAWDLARLRWRGD